MPRAPSSMVPVRPPGARVIFPASCQGVHDPYGSPASARDGGGNSPGTVAEPSAESGAGPQLARRPRLRRASATPACAGCSSRASGPSRSERTSSSAMPRWIRRSQRRSRTSHSREVSGLRTGRMPAAVRRACGGSTRSSFMVSRRLTTASPRCAPVQARGSAPMAMSLETNPTAPARRPASADGLVVGRGEQDDLHVGSPRDDAARRLEPVHAGHGDVHHDDVGVVVEAELDALAPALGLGDHDVARRPGARRARRGAPSSRRRR